MSLVALAGGVILLIAALSAEPHPWGLILWPCVVIFIAWRFFRLGVYVSDWGVRVSNVVTWWYPWRRIDQIVLDKTGELFARDATLIVLVTTSGRHRQMWGTATSTLFFRTSEELQNSMLEALVAGKDKAPVAASR